MYSQEALFETMCGLAPPPPSGGAAGRSEDPHCYKQRENGPSICLDAGERRLVERSIHTPALFLSLFLFVTGILLGYSSIDPMDNNFQTSFIPKKPLVEEKAPRTRKVSLFNFLATLVFFASLAAAGGMYFYKSTLETGIEKKQADLERAQAAFDPETISELVTLDRRISTSLTLLDSHTKLSPIFDLLSEVTLTTVQFTDFKFSTPENAGDAIRVQLIGIAPGYKTVGLEEEAFCNKSLHQKSCVFRSSTRHKRYGDVQCFF
jgi:hypothetical protein